MNFSVQQQAYNRWSLKKQKNEVLFHLVFYPALMGSKTPTSKSSESKEVRWGINCPLKSDCEG
ncbi:hypothetical protein FHY68_26300 [Bacillus pacificus]|nr:hypothetical protein FHY68_26300 [Bacillus pacificus]